jgi:RNA polymerase sigma factor (sigma-70 family)
VEGLYDLHTTEDAAEEFMPTDRQARVRDALNRLPACQREVIEKRYGFECEPMSLKETAAEEGVSRETVRRAQKRGEEWIRKVFEEDTIGREVL